MNLDMAGVAMWSVLYKPMKDLMCLTFVIWSSLVLIRELRLCGDTERKPPSLHIHPAMSADLGKIRVFVGSTLRLAKKSFSMILM